VVEVLKVSSRSNPNSVAGALAGVLRQCGAVEIQVVGAGALNQAVKAIAIARGFVAPSNIDLVCIPTFADIEIDGEGRTAIRLAVQDRSGHLPADSVGRPPATDASRPPGSGSRGTIPPPPMATIPPPPVARHAFG
jgi:stage V sporulation protein S